MYVFPCLNLKKHISFFPLDAAVIRVLEQIRDMPVTYPPELLKARRQAFIDQLNKRTVAVQSDRPG